VIAPNFSIGMNLFYAAVADAARRYLAAGGYDPWVAEWHHRAKTDAPGGTALHLAGLVAAASRPRARVHVGPAADAIGPGDVHVGALRAGHEPGRHVVGFDGPHDAVTLEHAARGRGGFAAGAVLAAEWLRGRRGIHGFDEVVEALVRGARKRGGAR
jgi:4-hydroxy-tetrahydrodipicolinate reductase